VDDVAAVGDGRIRHTCTKSCEGKSPYNYTCYGLLALDLNLFHAATLH
jgi:hypothetical protein